MPPYEILYCLVVDIFAIYSKARQKSILSGCGAQERQTNLMASVRQPWFSTAASLARATLVTMATFLPLSPSSAVGEYRLDVGDTLEISIVGMSDLHPRAKVNLDGEISLPLIGVMNVAGMSMSELRSQVQKLLPTKVFRHRTLDGRQELSGIDPSEIVIDVVEYRPIYVNGDIAKPGEQIFRPGLTVRQAISLAGGYDIMHFRMDNPFLESADLRAEYSALWTEFAKEQAQVWRLKTELRTEAHVPGADVPDNGLPVIPIPNQVISQIVEAEVEQLKATETDYRKEKAYLQQAIEEADRQFSVLREAQQQEQGETELDAADMAKVRGLLDKGLAASWRLSDERRSLFLAKTQLLQTTSQLAQIGKEKAQLGRKLEQVDDQRRMRLLRELEEAHVKLATIRGRLQAVGEKLLYTGTVKSQLVRGTGGEPTIVIFRKDNRGPTHITVDGDTMLMPGDVVEVTLKAELLTNLPSQ